MKNQYFGDNRDLFNYDLIYEIMKSGLVERLTFIPMLTENDGKTHGSKTDRKLAKVGTQNIEILVFLNQCVKNGKRDIKQLETFFKKQGINITLYARDTNFTHGGRQKYFDNIDNKLLSKSLVFVDPDIGLEVKNSGKEHLLFSEAKSLYDRMDRNSILMLFQFFPREDHMDYLHKRCQELKEIVMGDYPICIDDNEIIFFFLTKNKTLEDKLIKMVGKYRERYS